MKKDYVPVKANSPQAETEFVKNFWTKRWDQLSLQSGQVSKIFSTEEYKAIKDYFHLLPRQAKILDGGCGLDHWTQYFKSLGFRPTGLDISQKTIQRLKTFYPKDNYLSGDIRHTTFKNNTFDAYISWGTFEHFELGLKDCFQEAHRILKPKGLLFITIPFQNLRHILKGFFPQTPVKSNARFYQWRLTKQEIIQEMQLYQFKVIDIQVIHKAHGVRQFITHDLHVSPHSIFHKPLQILFYPILPKFFVSHMLMIIGKKLK